MTFQGKRFWIIGASSGIGRALARELALQGAQLVLSARHEEKLTSLHQELGSGHQILVLDAALPDAMKNAVFQLPQAVDSVIYLAADYQPASVMDMDLEAAERIINVNLMGALRLLNAIAPWIRQGRISQIALCGSVAGYVGLPNGQPYSATKAAIMSIAESLRAELDDTVDVKLISPGFVRTPMTDKNTFAMPMIISPEEAAKAIVQGLGSSAFEIHFPKRFTWIMRFLAMMPYRLYFLVAKKMGK